MEQSLIIAIVQSEDAGELTDRLVEHRFGVTRIDAVGGFLRRGNVAIVVGAPTTNIPTLLRIVEESCRTRTAVYCPPIDDVMVLSQPIEVEVGGAVIFQLSVEQQVQLTGRHRQDRKAAG